MLKSTVENLKLKKDPLGKLATSNAPYFKEGNLQLHAPFQRIQKTFIEKEKQSFLTRAAEIHPCKDVLTSMSLSISQDYWQSSFNMPIEEVRPSFISGSWLRGD